MNEFNKNTMIALVNMNIFLVNNLAKNVAQCFRLINHCLQIQISSRKIIKLTNYRGRNLMKFSTYTSQKRNNLTTTNLIDT